MEGAEHIKREMLAEAQKEVEGILKQSAARLATIKQEQKEARAAYETARKDERERAVQLFRDKTLAQARLRVRRAYLVEREKVVSSVVSRASKISHTSPAYQQYLKKLIATHAGSLEGEVTVLCNKKDVAFVSSLVDGPVEEADIAAGIIFANDAEKRIDETLAESIDRRMDEIREVVVKHLEK